MRWGTTFVSCSTTQARLALLIVLGVRDINAYICRLRLPQKKTTVLRKPYFSTLQLPEDWIQFTQPPGETHNGAWWREVVGWLCESCRSLYGKILV